MFALSLTKFLRATQVSAVKSSNLADINQKQANTWVIKIETMIPYIILIIAVLILIFRDILFTNLLCFNARPIFINLNILSILYSLGSLASLKSLL